MRGKRWLAAACLGCLSLAAPASAQAGCSGASLVPGSSNAAQIRTATLCLLNAARADHGLPALHARAQLRGMAQDFADEMAADRFFSHTGPDGRSLSDRLRSTSYLRGARRWGAGEDLAYSSPSGATPAAIVADWMNSSAHRANILSAAMRDVGIGVANLTPTGHDGATYVADFAFRVR